PPNRMRSGMSRAGIGRLWAASPSGLQSETSRATSHKMIKNDGRHNAFIAAYSPAQGETHSKSTWGPSTERLQERWCARLIAAFARRATHGIGRAYQAYMVERWRRLRRILVSKKHHRDNGNHENAPCGSDEVVT